MKWLVILFAVLVSCQQPESPPYEPPSPGVVIAVGGDGRIARSLDGGDTWQVSMGLSNKGGQIPLQEFKANVQIDGNLTVKQEINQGLINQVQAATAAIGLLNTQGFIGDLHVRGTLYQQLGALWTGPITNPFVNGINAIAYGQDVFVAVGNLGGLSRSTDYGVTWAALIANPFTAGPTNIMNVAYGNGVFVIAGASGKISRSTDLGQTWSVFVANPFPGGDTIVGLAYGNGTFVAGSTSGKLAYSLDLGQTWTLAATPFGAVFVETISWGMGVFIAGTTGGNTARSLDGISWSTTANPFAGNNILASCFGNGVFVIAGANGDIARSIDLGKTFGALITNPIGANVIYSISYNFGVFQIGAQNGETARSYDGGQTWGNLIANPLGSLTTITGIASSSKNKVAVGTTGGVGVIATAGWNAVPLGTGAFYAPMPQSAAGIGEWVDVESANGGALVLPAGGTWAWMAWSYAAVGGAMTVILPAGAVSAGGTQIFAGTAGIIKYCVCWRIA